MLKCEGIDDAGRKARPIPTSKMSLHGLVRHMTEVERGWFRRVIAQEDAKPILDYSVDDDADFEVPTTPPGRTTWRSSRPRSRSAGPSPPPTTSTTGQAPPSGTDFDLRWVYVHMIEEYARHNGHADLLRELVDGSVGD